MDNKKTLIFGTMYVDSRETAHYPAEWFLQIWKCAQSMQYEPLLIDSFSSLDFFPSSHRLVYSDTDFYYHKITGSSPDIISFGDNIGHLAKNGRDGWGRAFCQGLKIAMDNDFDYVVHVESDLLTRLDIFNVIGFMHDRVIQALTAVNHYNMIETGLMFFNVNYLRKSNLIEKYNYKEMGRSIIELPEKRLQSLIGDDLHISNLIKGTRGDQNQLTTENITDMHFITHTSQEVRRAFMALRITEVFK